MAYVRAYSHAAYAPDGRQLVKRTSTAGHATMLNPEVFIPGVTLVTKRVYGAPSYYICKERKIMRGKRRGEVIKEWVPHREDGPCHQATRTREFLYALNGKYMSEKKFCTEHLGIDPEDMAAWLVANADPSQYEYYKPAKCRVRP